MTDKDSIRAAGVGQDFGADTAEFDPAAPVTEAVEQDHRGTMMREFESYERIVEGLKIASDGARHMARWKNPDLWNTVAGLLDQLRRAVVKEAGFDRPADSRDSQQVFGGDGITWSDANTRLQSGLKDASAGARQIAVAQRMDLRWQRYANQFDTLRTNATKWAIRASPLRVAAQWGGGSDAIQ